MDYWALGHVHTRAVLRDQRPAVVYPGNPQGRHPYETGPRGAYLVDIDDDGTVALDFRELDVVRWARIDVPIDGLEREQDLLDAADGALDAALADVGRPASCEPAALYRARADAHHTPAARAAHATP